VIPMMAITRRVINAIGEDCRVMVEVFFCVDFLSAWSECWLCSVVKQELSHFK
jgi:hypothetical protein